MALEESDTENEQNTDRALLLVQNEMAEIKSKVSNM